MLLSFVALSWLFQWCSVADTPLATTSSPLGARLSSSRRRRSGRSHLRTRLLTRVRDSHRPKRTPTRSLRFGTSVERLAPLVATQLQWPPVAPVAGCGNWNVASARSGATSRARVDCHPSPCHLSDVSRSVVHFFATSLCRYPLVAFSSAGRPERQQQQEQSWVSDHRARREAMPGAEIYTEEEEEDDREVTTSQDGMPLTQMSSDTFSCLQDSLSGTELSVFSDGPGDKFRDLIAHIAKYSEVEALPALVFPTSRVVRLPSEKASDQQQALTLSTSTALVRMIDAWMTEFALKDHGREGPRAVAFHSIFKSRENRPSVRLFKSADPFLSMEAAKNPSLSFPWIVHPTKRFELKEGDMLHFESQVRTTLRALNFCDASLQAAQHPEIAPDEKEAIEARLPLAIRTMALLQTAMLGQIIQLRRDRYLALMKGIELDELRRLRHAKLSISNELFDSELLKEINDFARATWHNSAMLHVAGMASTPRRSQSQGGSQQTNAKKHKGKKDGSGQWPRSVAPVKLPAPLDQSVTTSVLPSTSPPVSPPSISTPLPVDFSRQLEQLQCQRKLQDSLPVGGRLLQFWQAWRAIDASRKVVRWFREGYRLPFIENGRNLAAQWFTRASPPHLMPNYSGDPLKQAALLEMIEDLLVKRAVVPLPVGEFAFFNRVFLVPKKTGGFRLILDVSKLNSFLVVKSFTMDTVQVIRAAVEPGMWGVSIDLSDAYHHIPVAAGHQRFLAFQLGERKFCYRACPFGLSPIPQVFTAALSPLKLHARKTWQVPVFQYLDDWLLLAQAQEQAAVVGLEFASLCMELGLLVNLKKSQLVPSQRLEHLGVDWDLQHAVLRPPVAKVDDLVSRVISIAETLRAPLPLLESVRGQMVAMEKVVRFGRINFRAFQAAVTRALWCGRTNRWVRLPLDVLSNLHWWSCPKTLLRGVPTVPPKPQIQVTTDASTKGWGAAWEGRQIQGIWSSSEVRLHINALELLAVVRSLQEWGAHWQGKSVIFLMDNRMAVAYLLKQGGTRSHSSTLIAEELFRLADGLNLFLTAAYLPGERNVLAHMLSRANQILKTEWRLGPVAFQWLCSRSPFGVPTVDLFANSRNFQCPKFISPCPDKGALAVDALTASWPQEVLYAFPPATILDRVLVKLHQEQPQRLILVAPLHTVAAWYPTLRSHAQWVEPFPLAKLQLLQPHWTFQHPEPELLCLGVWFITWRRFSRKVIPMA